MSRNRKWWHKLNHDRLMRDQFLWSLPERALGLLMRLQCMTGSTDEGYESGFVCSEDGARVSVDDFVFLFSRGDEKREAELQADLKVLARVKQVCPRSLEKGFIKLLAWDADQEAPTSADGARKRSAADERLFGEAAKWGDELERLSARLGGRRAFSDDEVLSYIKARRNSFLKTNLKFLEFLIESGVCARGADGLVMLAALASQPPAGVGVGSVGRASSQDAGAGCEISPDGKFPIERDPETESRKGIHSYSQLDSAGGGGCDASAGAGGTVQVSPHFERRKSAETQSASGSPPDASGSGAAAFRGDPHFERIEERHAGFNLIEPGDAYRCEDPLRGSIEFLERCPGWAASRFGDRPCSATVLKAKWRDLRQAIGPEESERIWRVCLDQAITDRLERAGWKSWVAIFMKRVDRQVEFVKG